MLARRQRQHGAAWREFLYRTGARHALSRRVTSLRTHRDCALNASAWPLFAGKKTWAGNDYFIPPVIDLQATTDLRVIGVFNAFRLCVAARADAAHRADRRERRHRGHLPPKPHPNSYFADQCGAVSNSSATSVCDGCSMYHRLTATDRSSSPARHCVLPGLLTASWGVDDEGNVHRHPAARSASLTDPARRDRLFSVSGERHVHPVLHGWLLAEDGTKESAYGVPSRTRRERRRRRGCSSCRPLLARLPARPGAALSQRTAAWVREKARTVPCKDGF